MIQDVPTPDRRNGLPVAYTLINSLSSYSLAANTAYAIVMMTSGGSQDVGWAESDTEATGDMGEFDKVNSGGNNGGAYGQMDLAVAAVPEASTVLSGLSCLGLLVFGQWKWLLRRRTL